MIEEALLMTKKTKILFVNFPTIPMKEVDHILSNKISMPNTTVIPLGILYLSSNLKERVPNVDVRILDFQIEIEKNPELYNDSREMVETLAREMAADFEPDLICFSMLFSIVHSIFDYTATKYKEIWPDAKIIVGGNHASNAIDVIVKNPAVDYMARGECDFAFPEFVRNFHDSESEPIKGIYSREHVLAGEPTVIADAPQDLDELAFPDWELLDMEQYISAGKGRARWRHDEEDPIRAMSFMTSRGCPFSCTFCAAHTTMGRKIRIRSDENVIKEMQALNDNYGINLYVPEDDLFTANRKKVISLLSEMTKFGKNVPNFEIQFPNALSVNTLFDDVMDALIDAGMKTTNVAVESGSPHVQRNIIKKNVKLDRGLEVIKYFRDRDVYVKCFFIAGFPGETKEMIEETIDYAKKLKCDWANLSIAVPLRGSEMYDQFIELGHITDDIDLWSAALFRERLFDTPEITADELKETMYRANLELNFLNNPNYVEKKWNKSIGIFEDMTKDYPFQIFGWYMLMKSLEGANRYEEAEKARLEIFNWIEKDPRSADLYKKYGHYLTDLDAEPQKLVNYN